jgi:hypothetical protein
MYWAVLKQELLVIGNASILLSSDGNCVSIAAKAQKSDLLVTGIAQKMVTGILLDITSETGEQEGV